MTLMRLQQDDPSRVGRYLLTARLGAGGMGIVYLGKAEDGRQVAVKVLRPEYVDDPETRSRFRQEAAAIARVRSPNAVRVLDADPDCETPYLATEFADGPSLEDHVKTYGPLHPEALVRLAAALAGALNAIHSADVMHRDLKPSNVLLTNTGPKVIDFGIARVTNASSITKTGMTIGSPGYMAPEQASGHSGQKSDIFAWALVVAFAASGRPPFGTGPPLAVLHRIHAGPPDISAVPPGLMPLVQQAIAKDPDQRPTAAELLRELSADPADLVTPADLAGAGAVVGAEALAAAAVREGAADEADGKLAATGEMAAAGDTADVEPGTGNAASSRSRRAWRAAAVAVPVVAAMVAAEVMLAQSGTQRAVHPPDHAHPRPAAARTPLQRAGDPGAVAGSGVPGSPSGGGSPAGSPHAAPSRVTRHPVRSSPSAPPSPTAPAPSSTAPSSPSTTPSSTPPSSPSTSPSSPAPSSPAPSGTSPSSASPSSASPSFTSPSASSSGSGSATPSASSS